MSQCTVRTTFNIPSEKKLWLVEITGANRKKFCGKRGEVLKSEEQTLLRVESEVKRRRFLIASVDDVKEENANFTFRRIKQLGVSAEDISYQFSFGFDNEIYSETMEGLRKEIQKRLKNCREHIEKALSAETAIKQLIKEV